MRLLETADKVLTGAQFSVSRRILMHGNYQPVPELGIATGMRTAASWNEWQVMEPFLENGSGSAIDVGCANGFFANRMADKGFLVFGIEQNERALKVGRLAAQASGKDLIAFFRMEITPNNIAVLPTVDFIVFKSAFQQWAVTYGFDIAMQMLRTLWTKAGKGMFFETAESLFCKPEYRDCLPNMGASPDENRQFVTQLLRGLGSCSVICLGYFETEYRNESRHLFFVKREENT